MTTITVLGAAGRTGQHVVAELNRRGYQVTAVDLPGRGLPDAARVVLGDARDPAVLVRSTVDAYAVISTLGPLPGVRDDRPLHRGVASALIPIMRDQQLLRYLGVSHAGVVLPGDQRTARSTAVTAVAALRAAAQLRDRTAEIAAWQTSGLQWTLVRPLRLSNQPGTGQVEHHPHRCAHRTTVTRADLAAFLIRSLLYNLYIGQAPLVANTHPP